MNNNLLRLMMSQNKANPPTYLLVSILLILVLHFSIPILRIIVFPWTLLGILLLVLGVLINLLADNLFKKHGTTVKPFLESTYLVTTGIFSVTRNPMYLGFVLILIGIAVLFGTLSPYIPIIICAFILDKNFIKHEESKLEMSFGNAWAEYTSHVRRWV
jgi:protein-S-isoprenylcysteine O-methyltransferase Ste14